MNLKRLRQNIGYALRITSMSRGKYAKKKGIFGAVGTGVHLPSMTLPVHSEKIFFHDNVEVATGVQFIVHDAIHSVFNRDPRMKEAGITFEENVGTIEVMDNVFIGAGTIVMPNVKIGPNAIIGAGSVITKDIPPNSVCVGVPARQIGTYEDLLEKRRSMVKSQPTDGNDAEQS